MEKDLLRVLQACVAVVVLLGTVVILFGMFPSMKSEVGAAWVQAIGSVVAIVVAVAVVRQQATSDRRLEQARRDLDRIHRFETVRAVMGMVYTIVTIIKERIDGAQFEDLAQESAKFLAGVDQAIKAIPVVEIPNTEQTVMILGLYNSGEKLGDAIAKFLAELPEDNAHKRTRSLKNIREQINAIRSIAKASKDRCEDSIRTLQSRLPNEMAYLMKEPTQVETMTTD